MSCWRPRLQDYPNTRMLLDRMVLKDVLQNEPLYKMVVMDFKIQVGTFIKKV